MSLPLYRPFETVSLENAVEDLVVRFILNVPPEDLATVERVLFHFEEASWFYTDFVKLMHPYLPNLSIRRFAKLVKDTCPLVWKWDITPEEALVKFSKYKQTIPVRGAAIFNENLTKLLLLKGSKSKYWSFPRGKIGKDEDDVTCCIREVKEETGFDLTGYINEEQYVERNMNGKNFKIFLVKGVPEDFEFKPEHKNEIEMIEWKDFRKLSKSIFKNDSSAKYFLVNSMIRPLSLYVKNEKRSQDDKKLRQYAEDHLKALLGLNIKENRIVLDAGREIMDMLQKSSKRSNKTSSQGLNTDAAVNTSRARNLFPIMSITPSTSSNAHHTERSHEVSPSPTSSPVVGSHTSSKEILNFLRADSESNKSLTLDSSQHLPSFPSNSINKSQQGSDYEEFESSSEEEQDLVEDHDTLNHMSNCNGSSTSFNEVENFKRSNIRSNRENNVNVNSKMFISKMHSPSPKPSNHDVVPTKPKIRLLKRGDKLEDLVSSDATNIDNTEKVEKGQKMKEAQSIISNEESPYSNYLLSLIKKSDNNSTKENFTESSNNDNQKVNEDSLMMKNTSHQNDSSPQQTQRKHVQTHQLDTHKSNPQKHLEQNVDIEQNGRGNNNCSKQNLDKLVESESKSPNLNDNASLSIQSNELLNMLKRTPITTASSLSPKIANPTTPQSKANELLNVLKNPNAAPNNRTSIKPGMIQESSYGSQNLPHNQPLMNGFEHPFPPQGYGPEKMQFGNPNFQPPQQFMYHQVPQHFVAQPTPTIQQPMKQSQELLNLLKNPQQSKSESAVSASSELLSILKK